MISYSTTRIMLLLGTFALAAPALAASDDRIGTVKKVVRYGDLNLASLDGMAKLERRVANAARSVCSVNDSRNLSARRHSRVCFAGAMADAQPQMALAASKAGTQLAMISVTSR